MSNTNIKSLKDKIKNLNNKQAYINIYKILKTNDIKLNINKNGIYFNINDLNDDLIKAIEELIFSYKIEDKPIQTKILTYKSYDNLIEDKPIEFKKLTRKSYSKFIEQYSD
jgi:hypothetical protein